VVVVVRPRARAPWLAPQSVSRAMTEAAASPRDQGAVVAAGTGITGGVTGEEGDPGGDQGTQHRHPGAGAAAAAAAGSGTTPKKAAAAGIETGTAAASGRLSGVGRDGAARRAAAGGAGHVGAAWSSSTLQGVGNTTQGMLAGGSSRGSPHQVQQQQEDLTGMPPMFRLQGPLVNHPLW
jgi:hypothetical protein